MWVHRPHCDPTCLFSPVAQDRGQGKRKEECSPLCLFKSWFEAGFIIPNYHQANRLTASLLTVAVAIELISSADICLARAWHAVPKGKPARWKKYPKLLNIVHARHIHFLSHNKSNIYSGVQERVLWNQAAWVQILFLPFASFVILGKFFISLCLRYSSAKVGIIVVVLF